MLTGSVKVVGVDNQATLPLSMVLEEMSGSEERRGSYSSVALGSIPRLSEVKGSVIQSPKSQASTVNKPKQEEEGHPDLSLPISEKGCVTNPVKKTVFSLLSQMDNASVSRKKCDGESTALTKTNENKTDTAESNNTKVPEPEEPCSPVRVMNCRLQSGDGSDMRPISSGSDDQECTSQLSPSRLRKVASACQPKAILHLDKQSLD